MKKNIANLQIHGKRWFQKSFGNTYHSVTISVNNETLYAGMTYGYDNHYLHTAMETLVDAGYDVPSEYNNFIHFLRDNGFSYFAEDVKRQKDL